MSVITKSTLVYPERQGTTFRAEDEINFYIPPSLSLLNTKSTALVFDLNMAGNLKKSVSQSAGAAALFQSITLSDGSGNTIYETLDSYGIQAAMYYFYTKIAGNELRELHEGKPNTVVFGYDSGNQFCEATATTAGNSHKKVEVVLPLYCVGCLTPWREKIFPLIATGGLRMRIVLATAERALQVLKTPVGVAATGAVPERDEDLTRDNVGGYDVNFQCTITNGNPVVEIARQIDVSHANFNNVNRALLWNNTSGAGAPVIAHPFVVGQSVRCNVDAGADVTKTITAITQNAAGQLLLTLSSNSTGVTGGGFRLRILSDSTTNTNENFEINNLRMQVSYAVASPQYLEAIQKSVAAGKMVIDIDTWTDYSQNISAGSLQNSMYIKSVNNRAKSIVSVPIKVAAGTSILEDSYQPDQQNVANYQFILYNVLTPNKAIQLGRFIKENGDDRASFDGGAVKEMSHAIVASGYPLNNIKYPWRHFFIGRKLANPGYSMNLNQEGDVRLSVAYDSSGGPVATLWHNCVHHIRRITIQGNQQQVTL